MEKAPQWERLILPYNGPNVVRVIKTRRMEGARRVYKMMAGKLKGKGPLGRPKRK